MVGEPKGHGVGLGTAIGVLAVVTFVAAGMARGLGDERVPVATLWALGLIAGGLALHRMSRRGVGARGPVVVALALGSVAPWIGLGALYAMSDPLVATQWRCGTGDMGLVMLAPVVVFFSTTTAALVGGRVAARERRPVDASLHVLATAAALISTALVGGSVARAARFPDPDHYIASMPVVAEVPALEGLTVPADGDAAEKPPLPIHHDPVGDLVVHRRCDGEACAVSLTRPGAPPRPAVAGSGMDRAWSQMVFPRGKLGIRHDAANEIWIVESAGAARTVFHGQRFECGDLRVGDVSRTGSPPRGWIAGAALGLALGAVQLGRRRRATRRLADVLAGKVATVADTGWLAFDRDDAPPVRLSPDARIPAGPAVVLAGVAQGQAYRDMDAGAVVVVAGEKEEIARALRVEIVRRSAEALAVLALTAAPLAAACVIGLVF